MNACIKFNFIAIKSPEPPPVKQKEHAPPECIKPFKKSFFTKNRVNQFPHFVLKSTVEHPQSQPCECVRVAANYYIY